MKPRVAAPRLTALQPEESYDYLTVRAFLTPPGKPTFCWSYEKSLARFRQVPSLQRDGACLPDFEPPMRFGNDLVLFVPVNKTG